MQLDKTNYFWPIEELKQNEFTLKLEFESRGTSVGSGDESLEFAADTTLSVFCSNIRITWCRP
jgi:hypothetical protein